MGVTIFFSSLTHFTLYSRSHPASVLLFFPFLFSLSLSFFSCCFFPYPSSLSCIFFPLFSFSSSSSLLSNGIKGKESPVTSRSRTQKGLSASKFFHLPSIVSLSFSLAYAQSRMTRRVNSFHFLF